MDKASGILAALRSLVTQVKGASATAEYVEPEPVGGPVGRVGVDGQSPFIGDWRMGWYTWQKPDAEPLTTAQFFVRWRSGMGLHGWRVRGEGGYTRFTGALRAHGRIWTGSYHRWDEGPFNPEGKPYATFVFVLSDCGNTLWGAWETDRKDGPQPMWAVRWRDSSSGEAPLPGWPPQEG